MSSSTENSAETACGGKFFIIRECDCLLARCDRCKLTMDIGWAGDRYNGRIHELPPGRAL